MFILGERASPSTPASGYVALYAKSDGRIYVKDDTGVEVILSASTPPKYIQGLAYANAADADHDITIAVGSCRDDGNAVDIILASALTKQIDAAWSVGNNAGGLDTGSVATSTWYYLWLIRRSDTGVVDALFSTSPTAPTMPASYDQKRLIGALITNSSANIVAFIAKEESGGGLSLSWSAPTMDIDSASLTTSRLLGTIKVPPAFSVFATVRVIFSDASGGGIIVIQSPEEADAAPSSSGAPLYTINALPGTGIGTTLRIRTSTGQIAARASGAIDTYRVTTIMWEWSRR